MREPAAEQVGLQGAGEAVLAEHHEHQHVAGHGHGQHERPVEPAAAGEVVERHEHREAAADERACRPRRRRRAARWCASASGRSVPRDVVEGLALADEAGGQRDQRADDGQRHERARMATSAPADADAGAAVAPGGRPCRRSGSAARRPRWSCRPVVSATPRRASSWAASSSSGPASCDGDRVGLRRRPSRRCASAAAPRGWPRTRRRR